MCTVRLIRRSFSLKLSKSWRVYTGINRLSHPLIYSEVQCLAMQRLHNGPVRSRHYGYRQAGVGVTHGFQLGRGLQKFALMLLRMLAKLMGRETCRRAGKSTDPAFCLHIRHLIYTSGIYSTHAYLALGADGVAVPPPTPTQLHALVVHDEAVPAIAEQLALFNVSTPPFVEPIGGWFFPGCCQPVAQPILQFDSG